MTKLEKYLLDHEISQAELARRIGYTQAGISRIINGSRQGGIALWLAIADVLGTTVDNIIGRDEEDGSGKNFG